MKRPVEGLVQYGDVLIGKQKFSAVRRWHLGRIEGGKPAYIQVPVTVKYVLYR